MKNPIIETAKLLKKQIDYAEKLDSEIVSLAFSLYSKLDIKPQYKKVPDNSEEVDIQFFNNKERIEILIKWSLEIYPFVKILENECKLPLVKEGSLGDIDGLLKKRYDSFVEALKKTPYGQAFDKKNISVIEKFVGLILDCINEELKGNRGNSYIIFKQAMEYFVGVVGDLKSFEMWLESLRIPNTLFRIREDKNSTSFSQKEDLFHIPFQHRGIVGSNRYSASGKPCLYLGSSLAVCMHELNKPLNESVNMYASAFKIKKKDSIKILEIGISPTVISEFTKDLFVSLYKGEPTFGFDKIFLTWVLNAACSIKVENPQDNYKQEYIISQLLTEWISTSTEYDGICYMSTKVHDVGTNDYTLYRNYVFPTKERKTSGYCPYLWSLFDVSKPKNISAYKDQIQDLPSAAHSINTYEFIFDVDGKNIPYKECELGKMEGILIKSF
ncbi:RES domain-containing protein [Bacillus altitudinis]|uniref:RES family NAD+ phosphorylase n=1 Tax=Bacillus altitudinis TaxID=293387 RepID=UPI002236BB75|nr:RES family NAD+ phosphorylase [Bacillus altitudinis]MCW4357547.1 RES domain-containing protein [Bacillus altitudinis]